MMSEGVGRKPPAVKNVPITQGELYVLYREAKRRAEFRSYRSKPTTWQQGLLGTAGSIDLDGIGRVEKDERGILVGLVGEYGIGKLVGIPIDDVLRAGGDGGVDLECHGLSTQVKAAAKESGANLVRVRLASGTPKPITARTLAFCHVTDFRNAIVRGWLWTDEARQLPEVPAHVGDHWNIDVPPNWLYPIAALVDEFEARRRLSSGNH